MRYPTTKTLRQARQIIENANDKPMMCAVAGVSRSWLTQVANGTIPEPTIAKLEACLAIAGYEVVIRKIAGPKLPGWAERGHVSLAEGRRRWLINHLEMRSRE
jgi:transcriptional regulator with XRE-family HTH domain